MFTIYFLEKGVNMEFHRNTTEAFIAYLKRHNYPEKSIVLEWGTKNCAVDIAIVADDLVTLIALFEIKGHKTKDTISRGIEQLKRATQMLDVSVPCTLVFGVNHQPYFEVLEVSDIIYNDAPINFDELLSEHPLCSPVSYDNISAGATVKAITKKKKEKQDKIDKIKPLCWGLFPTIGVILLLLDAFDVYSLTPLRLILMGAIVILVLIPFCSEITLKDFSFKRKK